MANNNNSSVDPGTVFIFVIIGLAVLFMMALAALAAIGLTILCICAWNETLTMGDLVITPRQARWFVFRGCIGALILPFVLVLIYGPMDAAHGYNPYTPVYVVIAGYTFGSLGIEYIFAGVEGPQPLPDIAPPPSAPPPAPPPAKKLPPQPFEYARWDDEEPR